MEKVEVVLSEDEKKDLAVVISPYHPSYFETLHDGYKQKYFDSVERVVKWFNNRR